MLDRLHVLWRHYSSWCLYALIALGGLQEASVPLADYLPRWVMIALAFAALAAKVVPQTKPPTIDPAKAAKDYAQTRQWAGKGPGRVEE